MSLLMRVLHVSEYSNIPTKSDFWEVLGGTLSPEGDGHLSCRGWGCNDRQPLPPLVCGAGWQLLLRSSPADLVPCLSVMGAVLPGHCPRAPSKMPADPEGGKKRHVFLTPVQPHRIHLLTTCCVQAAWSMLGARSEGDRGFQAPRTGPGKEGQLHVTHVCPQLRTCGNTCIPSLPTSPLIDSLSLPSARILWGSSFCLEGSWGLVWVILWRVGGSVEGLGVKKIIITTFIRRPKEHNSPVLKTQSGTSRMRTNVAQMTRKKKEVCPPAHSRLRGQAKAVVPTSWRLCQAEPVNATEVRPALCKCLTTTHGPARSESCPRL